jgi:hypothetical protein
MKMSPLEKKWKERADKVTYEVDEAAARWADAVSKPPGKVSQPTAGRPRKIARRTQTGTR